MSTLKVDTIRDNGAGFNDVVTFANSGGTENGRLCRTFVNFDGTGAVAIRANFNVNSITDNGTGDYTVNFANAMSDANYSVQGSARINSGGYKRIWTIKNEGLSSGSVRGQTGHSSVAAIENEDCDVVTVVIFR